MTERYTMTEKILDVLKSFSEIFDKHLVPAVLSFVLGIAVYLYVGDTYWMVNRLSTVVFVAFVACIAFLSITLLLWFVSKVKHWRAKKGDEEYYRKQEEAEQAENDKRLRDLFDSLPNDIIEIVKQLLESNNTPVNVEPNKLNEERRMYTRGYSTRGHGEFQTNIMICKQQFLKNNRWCYTVKLQDDAFKAAKYLVEKYGTLTRYDF